MRCISAIDNLRVQPDDWYDLKMTIKNPNRAG